MKQSKLMSMVESVVNIAIGFGISLVAQILILPLIGVHVTLSQNLQFALIMTAISIARSYVLRRVFEALHIRRPLSPGMQACIAERFAQIDREGFSLEHDDLEHPDGELRLAGACYIMHAGTISQTEPHDFPWPKWWKPQGYRRDLVRGIALSIAELERFDRLRSKRERKPRRGWDAAFHGGAR